MQGTVLVCLVLFRESWMFEPVRGCSLDVAVEEESLGLMEKGTSCSNLDEEVELATCLAPGS
jgi:hypothetical protein